MGIAITPKIDGVSSRAKSLEILTAIYARDIASTLYGTDRLRRGEEDKNLTPRYVNIPPGPRYDRTEDPYRLNMEHTALKASAIATVNESGEIVFEKDPSSPDGSSVESLVNDFSAFLDKRNTPYERKTSEQ